MAEQKKPRGRPVTRSVPPEPLPGTERSIIQATVKTRSKPELDLLKRKDASPSKGELG